MTTPDNNDIVLNDNNGIGTQTVGTTIGINTDPPQQPDVFLRRLPPSIHINGIPGLPYGTIPYVYPQTSGQNNDNLQRGTDDNSGLPPRAVYVPPENGRRLPRPSRSSSTTSRSSNDGITRRRDHLRRQQLQDQPDRGEEHSRRRDRQHRHRQRSSSSSSRPSSRSANSRDSSKRHRRRHAPQRHGLTSGTYYVPPQRGIPSSDWCSGCERRRCEQSISVRDFDTMQNVIRALRPDRTFTGAKDPRSGTTWITEMYQETKGHPDVVRYLWLKKYTSSKVWNEVTANLTPPGRCYRDYECQLEKVVRHLRKSFDTDEHLHKTEHTFNNVTQGKGSVYDFIERLEELSGELYHLGSPILEYKLKWKLYNGLNDSELQLRVNDDLDDKEVNYADFKATVLRQYRRMTNSLDVKSKRDPAESPRRDDSRGRYQRQERGQSGRYHWSRQSNRPRSTSVNSLQSQTDGYSTDDDDQRRHHINMGRDLSGMKCYRCLRRGHSAKDCQQEEPTDLSTRCRICGNPQHQADVCKIRGDKLMCYRCQNPGHLAYVCTSKKVKSTTSSTRRPPTPRPTTTVGMILDDGVIHPERRVYTTRTTSRQVYDMTGSMKMVIGNVQIEGITIPALFDTGAEVSLITTSSLQRLAPTAKINGDAKRHISVADGRSLQVVGTTTLTISTERITIKDEFVVITDDLSVPVLLGCPTLIKLKATIKLSSAGMHVITNDCHDNIIYSNKKMVRFDEPPTVVSDDFDRDYIYTDYKVNHVYQLLLGRANSTSMLSNDILYNVIYPNATIYPGDDSPGGQGDCNHSEKDPTTNYYVHYSSTTATTDSPTPHNETDTTYEEALDVDTDFNDNLPPWEVLIREWIEDNTTPLGRACVRVPWINNERPPYNFKNAANRGAASVRRLSPDQRQAFEMALKAYIDRGFCIIVKNNDVNGRYEPPTFDECQAAWDTMTYGTSLEGTVVIKPYHYTPSHTVFRDNHPTTPCRIVLDFRTLNHYARRGGKTQNDLQGVLLQLRSFKFFISADVSKAFCQMKASLYDVGYSSYTCIGNYTVLWSSIAFGSNNAPCMLEACSNDVVSEINSLTTSATSTYSSTASGVLIAPRLLSDEQIEKALLRPSATGVDYVLRGPSIPMRTLLLKYVDDLYFGGKTKDSARQSYDFGTHIFNGHGFNSDPVKSFCSWLTNDVDDDNKKKSVLGYVLRLDLDKFFAVYSGYVPDNKVTKLQACAALASLYDPLGLYVELDLQGRLLWREICSLYKGWDDTIKEELVQRLRIWATTCREVTTTIGFERYIDLENYPLLISSDASGECWGVDVRCVDGDDTTTRVMARGGVFPQTQSKWSIPRKELVALYHALMWVRSTSLYLPVTTCLRPHQAQLDPLAPHFPARQVTLLCDSEITVYRLRRPGRDKKLPIVERRRLKAIREMCRELDVIIKHIPSELNYADSVSRAKFNEGSISGAAVLKAATVSNVVYDYREAKDEIEEDTTIEEENLDYNDTTTTTSLSTNSPVANATTLPPTNAPVANATTPTVTNSPVANATKNLPTVNGDYVKPTGTTPAAKTNVMMLNVDGIDLPNFYDLDADEQEELKLLARYAKPVEEVEEELQHDGNYETTLMTCLLRAQSLDKDLRDFNDLLKKKVTANDLGVKGVKLRRLARICYLDENGLIRRHPSPERLRKVEEDVNGVVYLGNNSYTAALIKLLAVIYHYKHLHLGARRVCNLLQRRFYCKRMTRLVSSSLRSCTSCIKARATRQFNYVVNNVQNLLTTGLWQILGVDVAGPYDRATKDTPTDATDSHYVLLVQDYVSGFTSARPLPNLKAKTVADGLHGIFCEHGSPAAILTDHDRTSLLSRQVRRVLQRHGSKHYVLPSYSQHLSFWERPHKDMVDVVKAIRESRHKTERSNIDDTFINDFLLAVRAYNSTPRGWANVTPAELHYVYKGRLPGEQEGLSDLVDWESLRLKHSDVDIIKTLRDTIPMIDDIKQHTKATLNDYFDYWRLKQERLLERYALERSGNYVPKIYDIVFTTKTGDVQVGGHLETSWSGPSTITKLRGSAVVEVSPGIILPDIGGVYNNVEKTEVYVPIGYGEAEAFPLRNVHYASGLHDVIHKYYAKGTRVFVDSDGSIKSIGIDSTKDLDLLRQRRYQTAMDKNDWPQRGIDEEDNNIDCDSSRETQEDGSQLPIDYNGDNINSNDPLPNVIPDEDISRDEADIPDENAVRPTCVRSQDVNDNSGELIENSMVGRGDIETYEDGITATPSRNVIKHHADNNSIDLNTLDGNGTPLDDNDDTEDLVTSPEVDDFGEFNDAEDHDVYSTPNEQAIEEDDLNNNNVVPMDNTTTVSSSRPPRRRTSISVQKPWSARRDELRDIIGTSTRHTFGKFITTAPMNDSIVMVVDDDYTGVARVIRSHMDGNKVNLQPMNVVQEGVLTKITDDNDKATLDVEIGNLIYVRPSTRSMTRGRGKELRDLLSYIGDFLSQ